MSFSGGIMANFALKGRSLLKRGQGYITALLLLGGITKQQDRVVLPDLFSLESAISDHAVS